MVRSSSTHGDSRLLTRVHSCVSPRSISLADADQAVARGLLAIDRHRVLEVAEQDVDGRRDVGHLGDHLLVGEVEEVDHPRRLERDLEDRIGGADRQWLAEVAGVSHVMISWSEWAAEASVARRATVVRAPNRRRTLWRWTPPSETRPRPTRPRSPACTCVRWQSAYRGLIADEILGGLSIDQRRERWLGRLRDEAGVGPIPFTLVAERDGAVVGSARSGASTTTPTRRSARCTSSPAVCAPDRDGVARPFAAAAASRRARPRRALGAGGQPRRARLLRAVRIHPRAGSRETLRRCPGDPEMRTSLASSGPFRRKSIRSFEHDAGSPDRRRPIRRRARPPARTPTAVTWRSSRSAPSTSTGRPRP